MNGTFLIDFDSTFIQTETLEVLAEVLSNNDAALISQIEDITNQAMAGNLDFNQALLKRIEILKPSKTDIEKATGILKTQISNSFIKNQSVIKENSGQIYIVSGGFKSMIEPIVSEYGIAPDHVFANEFVFDGDTAIGVDNANLMAYTDGKAKLIQSEGFNKPVYMIGDGISDAMTQNSGATFIAFTENVQRDNVCERADMVVKSFDEVLAILELNTSS